MGRKKSTEDQPMKPKAIGPFDILHMIFTDINSFNSLSKAVLAKNYFMVNRVFAIQYPMQAQCFNHKYTDPAMVIRSWAAYAQTHIGYGRVPAFVYTKGTKKAAEENRSLFSKEEKESYCIHYGLSLKDFEDLDAFSHNDLTAHVKEFLEQSDPSKQISKMR